MTSFFDSWQLSTFVTTSKYIPPPPRTEKESRGFKGESVPLPPAVKYEHRSYDDIPIGASKQELGQKIGLNIQFFFTFVETFLILMIIQSLLSTGITISNLYDVSVNLGIPFDQLYTQLNITTFSEWTSITLFQSYNIIVVYVLVIVNFLFMILLVFIYDGRVTRAYLTRDPNSALFDAQIEDNHHVMSRVGKHVEQKSALNSTWHLQTHQSILNNIRLSESLPSLLPHERNIEVPGLLHHHQREAVIPDPLYNHNPNHRDFVSFQHSAHEFLKTLKTPQSFLAHNLQCIQRAKKRLTVTWVKRIGRSFSLLFVISMLVIQVVVNYYLYSLNTSQTNSLIVSILLSVVSTILSVTQELLSQESTCWENHDYLTTFLYSQFLKMYVFRLLTRIILFSFSQFPAFLPANINEQMDLPYPQNCSFTRMAELYIVSIIGEICGVFFSNLILPWFVKKYYHYWINKSVDKSDMEHWLQFNLSDKYSSYLDYQFLYLLSFNMIPITSVLCSILVAVQLCTDRVRMLRFSPPLPTSNDSFTRLLYLLSFVNVIIVLILPYSGSLFTYLSFNHQCSNEAI
jgi:hypothetical protein